QRFASTSTAPIYAALNDTPVDSSTAPDSSLPPPPPPPPPGILGRSIDAPKIGALTRIGYTVTRTPDCEEPVVWASLGAARTTSRLANDMKAKGFLAGWSVCMRALGSCEGRVMGWGVGDSVRGR